MIIAAIRNVAVTLAWLILLTGVAPAETTTPKEQVRAQIGRLLERYAANDADEVVALMAPEFVLYGSDVAEICRTPEQLRKLMADDFRLWGTATFNDIRDEDIRVFGKVATANFHVSFSAGGGKEVPVRFSMTLEKINNTWRIVQSANTVPTQGSSAAELTGSK
ncbi:MAG: hypothetical protein AMXMBFR59_18760 [Rhodanobacteraceae bacterium]